MGAKEKTDCYCTVLGKTQNTRGITLDGWMEVMIFGYRILCSRICARVSAGQSAALLQNNGKLFGKTFETFPAAKTVGKRAAPLLLLLEAQGKAGARAKRQRPNRKL